MLTTTTQVYSLAGIKSALKRVLSVLSLAQLIRRRG